jgi:hypothetical protein
MLEHADRDDAVEGLVDVAVVLQPEIDLTAEFLLARPPALARARSAPATG